MAALLDEVSKELGSINGADHLAERRLIRYLRTLDIEADSAVFRDGRGRLRAVIESGNLAPLLRQENYLDRLSEIVGLRLSKPKNVTEGCARLYLTEAEPLAVSVGIAAMKKKGEKVSGDRGTYFKTDAGVLRVLACWFSGRRRGADAGAPRRSGYAAEYATGSQAQQRLGHER